MILMAEKTDSNKPEMKMIDFDSIQKKWQQRWADAKVFKSEKDSAKKKFYVLEMFPYPSGSGLHMVMLLIIL